MVKCVSELEERKKLLLLLSCIIEENFFILCDCEDKEGCKYKFKFCFLFLDLLKKLFLLLDLLKREVFVYIVILEFYDVEV